MLLDAYAGYSCPLRMMQTLRFFNFLKTFESFKAQRCLNEVNACRRMGCHFALLTDASGWNPGDSHHASCMRSITGNGGPIVRDLIICAEIQACRSTANQQQRFGILAIELIGNFEAWGSAPRGPWPLVTSSRHNEFQWVGRVRTVLSCVVWTG